MIEALASVAELVVLLPAAMALSWIARRSIRAQTRRSVRRAQSDAGSWRVRLPRNADIDGQGQIRRRMRADAAARKLGHLVTGCIFVGATLIGLNIVGVDAVLVISSAGFLGLALALSGQ
ncbi:MAG: small-conductance mechanosensitive channel, partial [Ilumatobacter sp.]